MTIQKRNDFNDIFLNRKSIRKYDTTHKISNETIKQIVNETLRTPSANNLEPWYVVAIATDEAKKKYSHLFPYNRLQYETSSVMFVLFADLDYAKNANEIFQTAVDLGQMDIQTKERQLERFTDKDNMPKDVIEKSAIFDTGLLAMSLMLVARSHGFDTCPIGGFDKENAAGAFNLVNYEAVVAVSMGLSDDTGYDSIRLPFDKIAKIF
ncbi:MAG TPA: nitroreductase family protein [Acholeplasma sp.]|nr:nitroreductase family protein [Acholeplasma sp.]